MIKAIRILVIAAVAAAAFTMFASAVDDSGFRCVVSPENGESTTICIQNGNLFLPAAANLHHVTFEFPGETAALASAKRSISVSNGKACDIASLWSAKDLGNNYCAMTIKYGDVTIPFTMYRADSISSLYITSADLSKGRAWVDQSKDHKAEGGRVVLLDQKGNTVYAGELGNIKGRGNSTWGFAKKPYQIKLTEKVDFMATGDSSEKSKTWVLLANYIDETSLRNTLTFEFAKAIGLPYIPNTQMVDLYYDGEYRGLYQLSEKTEVGKGRIAIHDLESDIMDAGNIEDADSLPAVQGVTSDGLACQYVEGLTLPGDYSGGYLLEQDLDDRAQQEKSWFKTKNGNYVVCKAPEYLPLEGVTYISHLYQRFENAVYHGGIDPESGKKLSELVDLESLAKVYCIEELAQDYDAFKSSSYFYKPAGEDKLYAGPVWDFDASYGTGFEQIDPYTMVAAFSRFGIHLANCPEFQQAVAKTYKKLPALVSAALSDKTTRVNGVVQPLARHAGQCEASRQMDAVLWPETTNGHSFDASVTNLKAFLSERNKILTALFAEWENNEGFFFKDVAVNAWYWDSVQYAALHGLMRGIDEIRFAPDKPVNRATLATVLYRMAGEPAVDAGGSPFADVTGEDWFFDAVVWAYQNGVVNGLDAQHFNPNTAITRQDLAVMLWRYFGCEEKESSAVTAKDYSQVSEYAQKGVNWMVAEGIFKNDPEQGIMPLENTTRAQLSTVLMRLGA